MADRRQQGLGGSHHLIALRAGDGVIVLVIDAVTEMVAPGIGKNDLVFAVIDAAFGQRRKMLRAALKGLCGSSEAASAAITAAGIDPAVRGEMIDVAGFARIAEHIG